MSARDELYAHIYGAFDALDDPAEKRDTPAIITEVLLAAGYSKPRTISTVEELDALPFGSVVIDRAEWVLCKRDERRYAVAGSAGQYSAATIEFPATVLYTPKES